MSAWLAGMSPMVASSAGFMDRFWFGDSSFTDGARSGDWMFMFIWWLSVFFFVLLMGLMVVFSIKYRRRVGKASSPSPAHNTPLEVTWTIIPTIFFVIMFFEGFRGYVKLNYAPAGAIQAELLAFQWSWELSYPGGQVTTEAAMTTLGTRATNADQHFVSKPAPVWYFPEEQAVLLRMTSRDVIHSFWVPDFRVKMDVFPNRYTSYTFTPDPIDDTAPIMEDADLGAYRYRDHVVLCAEYCGNDHSEMAAIIRVVPREIYEAKLELFGSPRGTLADRGKIVAQQKGCVSCHTPDGTGSTGPTWKNLYNNEFQYTDGSTSRVDDNHIREAVYEPGAKIRAGFANQMVTYQGSVSPEQLGWLIAYMQTLSDSTTDEDRAAAMVDPDAQGAGEGGTDGG